MDSLANPPFGSIRDCSQGICNVYCSQWCYRAVFPPPPPVMNTATSATFLLAPTESDDTSSISPFVIAIIGILAAAFLLVAYYTVTSKYCTADPAAPPAASDHRTESFETADEVMVRDAGGGGVEESLIKSITVCRYRKGEAGVMGITDCSVCLAEFRQDESLRLLPKCCHAFHVRCIDTWLRSNSTCPLCRAHILPLPAPPQLASQTPEARRSSDHTCVTIEDSKRGDPAMGGEGPGPGPSTVEKSKNHGSGPSVV